MNFLQNICDEILSSPNIQTCLIYPNARGEILAPAVFLEIASYGAGSDPATGELALIANIEARVVVDSTIEDAEIICQSLACEIANLAHLNSFGCEISPAKINGITLKTESDGKLEVLFKNGVELKSDDTYIYVYENNVNVKSGNAEISVSDGKISCNSGNCSIISDNDQITLSAGGASITLSSNGIQLSCGSSTIDLSSSNISLNSTSISTMPPVCKCAGGL